MGKARSCCTDALEAVQDRRPLWESCATVVTWRWCAAGPLGPVVHVCAGKARRSSFCRAQGAADIAVWLERQAALGGHDAEADYQTDYLRDIIAPTDYPEFDLDTVSALFKQWMRDKEDNILGYRDNVHRSVMTGTMAGRHHTRGINAMDDSQARYLQGPSENVDTGALTALIAAAPTGQHGQLRTPGR